MVSILGFYVHRRTRITLGRFQDKCVSSRDSQWNCPERNHSREIKWRNTGIEVELKIQNEVTRVFIPGAHAQRQPPGFGIHVFADFEFIPEKIGRNGARGFDYLKATSYIA
jgi:hypothetical protein